MHDAMLARDRRARIVDEDETALREISLDRRAADERHADPSAHVALHRRDAPELHHHARARKVPIEQCTARGARAEGEKWRIRGVHVRRRDEHHRVVEPALTIVDTDDRQVDATRLEQRHRFLGQGLDEREHDVRVRSAKAGQNWGQEIGRRCCAGTDPHLAPSQTKHLTHRTPTIIHRCERSPSVRQQGFPRGRRRRAAAAAMEELRAVGVLEPLDGRRQRRLGQMRPPRRLGERTVLRYQQEVSKLVDHRLTVRARRRVVRRTVPGRTILGNVIDVLYHARDFGHAPERQLGGRPGGGHKALGVTLEPWYAPKAADGRTKDRAKETGGGDGSMYERTYKVLHREEWDALEREGIFAGSADDLRDGFIHLSAAHQLAGTLRRHFDDAGELRLLEIPSRAFRGDATRDLRHEPSRAGALFPHLYGPLKRHDVHSVHALKPTEAHMLPTLPRDTVHLAADGPYSVLRLDAELSVEIDGARHATALEFVLSVAADANENGLDGAIQKAMLAKAMQHGRVRAVLLGTGDATLVHSVTAALPDGALPLGTHLEQIRDRLGRHG